MKVSEGFYRGDGFADSGGNYGLWHGVPYDGFLAL